MNILTTVTDGERILRLHGSFGQNKTVTINNYAGVTYIHLKCPKKNGGMKSFTMSMMEYRELMRLAGPTHMTSISENFDIQVRSRTYLKKKRLFDC